MVITISCGFKTGKSTLAAAITQALVSHGIKVEVEDGPLGADNQRVEKLVRDPKLLGELLRIWSDRGLVVHLKTEQPPS